MDVPMIGRLAGLRGTLSSHWLASAFAGIYLVGSLVLAIALLSMPKQSRPATVPGTPAAIAPSRGPAVPEKVSRRTAAGATSPKSSVHTAFVEAW